jgi:hypothetical protein
VGPRLSIDWSKLGVLLRRGYAAGAPLESWKADMAHHVLADPPMSDSPVLDPFHGLARWTLLARDWDGGRLLVGHLAATDQMRRGRSRRMVLARSRFFDGPFSPFVEVGLGQWRVDPDTPTIPHEVVLAGEAGGGLELALWSWGSVAIEAGCTVLQPERATVAPSRPFDPFDPGRPGAPEWIRPTVSWGTFLAARAGF